jgi:hypothetical protein
MGGVLYLAIIVLGAFTEGYFGGRYLPKLIGIAMQLAGLSYLIACISALFAAALANPISPAILLPPLIGGVTVARYSARVVPLRADAPERAHKS